MSRRGPYEVIAVGASWGALSALRKLLGALPANFGPAVIIVPHRGKDHERLLPDLLGQASRIPVCEVEDKQQMIGGVAYLAPADYHLFVDETGHFELNVDEPVRFSRPSIDVSLQSVADTFAERAVGIVLTGANEDGARGLRRIADRGGLAIVQDPATAEVAIMPTAALAAVPEAVVLPLEKIAGYVAQLPTAAPASGATP